MKHEQKKKYLNKNNNKSENFCFFLLKHNKKSYSGISDEFNASKFSLTVIFESSSDKLSS